MKYEHPSQQPDELQSGKYTENNAEREDYLFEVHFVDIRVGCTDGTS